MSLNKSDFQSVANIAVLFARADSIYKTLADVDVWDIERNALNWTGACPVVAHPPCRGWGRLRHMANPRPGELDLARWAVRQVRAVGGVLEHPIGSLLWTDMALPKPGETDAFGGWTLPIHQHWFGHRATKATWLYIVGVVPAQMPRLPLVLGEAQFVIGSSGRRADGTRSARKREVSKAEREHTPPELAVWLVNVARLCAK
jgi:hypothetical protein